MQQLDPYQRPPDGIRNVYKTYQKMKLKELDQDQDIIDLANDASTSSSSIRVVKTWKGEDLTASFLSFAAPDGQLQDLVVPDSIPVYEHNDMPGKANISSSYSLSISLSSFPSPHVPHHPPPVLTTGRSPHDSLTAPARNPIHPPLPPAAPRSLHPRPSDKHPHTLHHFLPTLSHLLLFTVPRLTGNCGCAARRLRPQASHRLAAAQ